MITLVAFFSFILNIIAFLAIIILYLRQNRFLDSEKKQQELMNEMENLFSSYILEMKEENEQFLSDLQGITSSAGEMEAEKKEDSDIGSISHNKNTLTHPGDQEAIQAETYSRMHAAKVYKSAVQPAEAEETAEPADTSSAPEELSASEEDAKKQMIFLQQKGLSVDEIAKQLNKGKTEVELFLKFHQSKQ